jgi:hypothetical protein
MIVEREKMAVGQRWKHRRLNLEADILVINVQGGWFRYQPVGDQNWYQWNLNRLGEWSQVDELVTTLKEVLKELKDEQDRESQTEEDVYS